MEYRIENKKVRIYSHHLEQIGEGKEGKIYKYNGSLLKLYHDYPKKDVLSFKDCEYMTKLNTERVLLPTSSVTDKHHLMRGYTISPYIDGEADIYEIIGKKFLQERQLVQLELIYLGENFVSVDDLCLSNFKVFDKFYLLDPGSYEVKWDMLDNHMEKNIMYYLANLNIEYFDEFLYEKVFLQYIRHYIGNIKLYRNFLKRFTETYLNLDYTSKMDCISSDIVADIPLRESIHQIVKKYTM